MPTVQPTSLTDDEFLRFAEDMLLAAEMNNSTKALPLNWQRELIKRYRRALNDRDDARNRADAAVR